MENISPDELALELLHQCLRGNDYSSELLRALVRRALSADPEEARKSSHALFQTVVEPLCDQFEPCLADVYAALFSEVIADVCPELDREAMLQRFRQIRDSRPFAGLEPRRVYVLSRVTLGADAAITSVVLDGVKQRFPASEIIFAGPGKNFRLFAADPRLRHWDVPYRRDGTLSGRLSILPALQQELADPHTLVVDPDSRLSQLGLLPICDPERHLFFESRSYGEYENASLGELTERWVAETFGVPARAYLALPPGPPMPTAEITVSLGVGDNPSKKLAPEFERGLLEILTESGRTCLVDRGGSAEEGARVDNAASGLHHIHTITGPFEDFARSICASRFYAGYDSAGQHIAAVFGIPLLCIFAGYPSQRFLARWQPWGRGPRHIVAASGDNWKKVLLEASACIKGVEKIHN